MTSIEQTGKTIEEATQKALEQLGVTEDEVDVEILEEGARGFLGLGQAPARVKVTLKQRPTAVEQAPAPPTGERLPRPKPAREPREARPKPAPAQEKPAPAPEPEAAHPQAPAEVAAPPTEDVVQPAAQISLKVLQRIVSSIEADAKVGVKSAADGQVVLEVQTGDPATMIGKHGQTVDAIQYLVGVITNKQLPQKVRVVVDVEGYRSRREEALRNQAVYLASKVKESGEEAVLEPLPANERRIIHTALADDPEVYTYSEGEEPERYVVISPKK